MRWSTAEVARMSGVSSRTLRHYDHTGLLRPARTGHGGSRFYERPQLERLQHILVLRELGLGLPDIGAVLDGAADELAALMRAGAPVDDPAVQEVVARHHAWVCHFWTPGREACTGLGRLYVDDPRFTASIDATGPGLSAYLRDAIAVHAERVLT